MEPMKAAHLATLSCSESERSVPIPLVIEHVKRFVIAGNESKSIHAVPRAKEHQFAWLRPNDQGGITSGDQIPADLV